MVSVAGLVVAWSSLFVPWGVKNLVPNTMFTLFCVPLHHSVLFHLSISLDITINRSDSLILFFPQFYKF